MNRTTVQERATGLNSLQIATVVFSVLVVTLGFLVKLDRAPSFGETLLDPIRLLVPCALLFVASLRQKLGVTRRFAMLGIACVALTMLSEAFRASFGIVFLIPAFAVFVWMLGNSSKNRGIDSSWAGLALCFIMAPVF